VTRRHEQHTRHDNALAADSLQGYWVQMTRLTGRIHVAAYKAMCLTHHPDRHTSSPEPLRKAAEERFKQLQDALSILGGCALTGGAGLSGLDKGEG
jgi:EAL domain-containing protein (putative c-di-GMP-specific phosphodiesterase class I)